MNLPYRILRHTWLTAWYGLALLVVLAALSLSLARLVLPVVAEKYDREIEALISELLHQPVTIGSMDAEWRGLGPRLVLREVLFFEPGGRGAVLNLERAALGFDLLSLLRHGRLGLSSVSLSGFNLILHRLPDGRISVAGMDAMPETGVAGAGGLDLRAWLLSQHRLEVEHANIFWIDQRRQGHVWQFNDVRFLLRNTATRHQAQGYTLLPDEVGKELAFNIDVNGNPLNGGDWDGQVFVRGVGLNLATVNEEFGARLPTSGGTVNFRIWSAWHNAQLRQAQGELHADDLALVAAGKKPLQLDHAGGRFLLRHEQEQWQLDMTRFQLRREQHQWPLSDALVQWRQDGAGISLSRLSAGYLDIGEALLIAQHFSLIPADQHEAIAASRPSGILRNFSLQLPTTAGGTQVALQTEFSGVSSRPWGQWPGVTGVTGSLVTDMHNFKLQISGSAMSLDYPTHYAKPLFWNELDGVLYGELADDYLFLSSNELLVRSNELHGHGQFTLFWPRQRRTPWLALVAQIEQLQLPATLDALPNSVIGDGFRHWWQHAITQGQAGQGQVLLSGWLEEYPFAEKQGLLTVSAQLSNGHLDYISGWPAVSHIDGALLLRDNRLQLQPVTARIFDSRVEALAITIEDIAQPQAMAHIVGDVSGASEEKLRYLLTAPPLHKVFHGLESFTLRGSSDLHLDMMVPTSGDQAVQLRGELAMRNNALLHKGALGAILTDATGVLEFTGDSVEAHSIAARVFDQPVTIDASTGNGRNGDLIKFVATGRYRIDSLRQRLALDWGKDLVQGVDDFSVVLELPVGSELPPAIQIDAQLDQLQIDLPPPLGKNSGDADDLSARLLLLPQRHDWTIRYGGLANAALEMLPLDSGYTLARGEVVIGKEKAGLSGPPGLSVRGNLAPLSADAWLNSIAPRRPGAEVSRELPVLPAWFTHADLAIDRLTLFGRDYEQCSLAFSRDATAASLQIHSKQLSGTISLPEDRQQPLALNLDSWNIVSVDNKGGNPPDPNGFPAMVVNARELAYNGRPLGSLNLTLTPTTYGVHIGQFAISSAQMNINGDLDWVYRSGRHIASIDMAVDSRDVGKSMSALGYANTIENGSGSFKVKADWSGPPYDPLRPDLKGEIKLKFTDGRLLDLNPGAGKILAILSLQMLPKRLLLDFSDLFKKGFSFEQISADFSIRDGDAYTTNLIMTGPSAKIHVAGRTGLVERDYDQLVTVIPDVTASLPVLAWWLVDPATGLLAFALQKIFQDQIDDVVKFQYIITGSWENPVVTKASDAKNNAAKP